MNAIVILDKNPLLQLKKKNEDKNKSSVNTIYLVYISSFLINRMR